MVDSFIIVSSCAHCRQLLRYSFRYSASFARQTQQRELERVEQLLNGYHGNTMQFLLDHFSQTSVS